MQLQAPQFWESKGIISCLLWPLSLIYGFIISIRKFLFHTKVFPSSQLPVPVIFVGNIRVGGTGKTPCVIALAKALHQKGFQPGIITRGYRSQLSSYQSKEVLVSDQALAVGDEALLMAQHLQDLHIPVWIGAKRYLAGHELLKKYPSCNVIISDDGLQHAALARHAARNGGKDIEIIVRDNRRDGNGWLLPAGPLREPNSRPRDLTVDMNIVHTAFGSSDERVLQAPPSFQIPCFMRQAYQLTHPGITQDLKHFLNQRVLAVAGIAAPDKFFQPLKDLGLRVQSLALEDHAYLTSLDWNQYPKTSIDIILMTEKDAVKCQHLGDNRIWVVPLEAVIPNGMIDFITEILYR